MATDKKRLMVSIPADIQIKIEQLKQWQFFDKPYSELYRQALRYGVEILEEQQQKEAQKATV